MGKYFPKENFCSDNFDQEMLDFIKGKYAVFKKGNGGYWSTCHKYLKYNVSNNYFWTSDIKDDDHYKVLTKVEMKEKIGMAEFMTTTFSKKDLVAGKHVVKFKDETEGLHLYLSDDVLVDTTGFATLDYMNEDLSCKTDDDFTIVAVYEIARGFNLSHLSDGDRMTLIWKREEKSETQIQFEKLQQQITELQAQANKLQATL